MLTPEPVEGHGTPEENGGPRGPGSIASDTEGEGCHVFWAAGEMLVLRTSASNMLGFYMPYNVFWSYTSLYDMFG